MIMKDEKLVVLREWNSVTEAEMAYNPQIQMFDGF